MLLKKYLDLLLFAILALLELSQFELSSWGPYFALLGVLVSMGGDVNDCMLDTCKFEMTKKSSK